MTVEELEIIVNASIEPALKEIKKLMPQIKQQVTQAVEVTQKSMEQIDMRKVSNKVQNGVQLIKKHIENIKKSSKNNEIAITVNNKDAKEQISQVQKQIDSLQKKINARQLKLDVINPQIDKIVSNTRREVTPDGISTNNTSMDKVVDNALFGNKDFKTLNSQAQKLYTEIEMYNKELNEAKIKMAQLGQQISQTATTQNKLSSFLGTFKGKLEQARSSISGMKDSFNQIPKITQKITNNIKNMGTSLKGGLKHVLRYAMALFSLRGIYSVLSNSASSWLSSQNAGAQQLSANIEYMKYAMGNVFAPVIEYVINLIYQLMKAIQSVVYAFSGINIFAKATASSMNKTASSANKASKSLAGVHNEINNVSDNKENSGSGSATPSMDLSQVDSQMNSFAQKLYDFFKPLKESWNTYGGSLIEQVKITASQISELFSSIWGSFENIITNGTAYSILENILSIIGSISEAFANVWNNDGNGDAIIQNLANALNNLFEIMEKIVQSTVFQWILDTGVFAIEKLTEAVEWVTQKINEFVGFLTGSEDDLDGWAILIGSIVSAVLLLVAAIAAYNAITTIMGIVTAIATSPLTLIVLAIAAVIAIIVLCVKHWQTIQQTITNVCNNIKIAVSNAWNGIWTIIKNVVNFVLGGIEGFVNGTIRGINKVLSGISQVASAIGSLIGLKPINLQLSTISLPRLAKGNVAYSETVAVFGEYSGASNNPEITAPQNIMRETFEDVLSNHEWNKQQSSNGELKQLVVQFGSTKVALEMERLLQQARRQNGIAYATI